jgi:hypothetical protein
MLGRGLRGRRFRGAPAARAATAALRAEFRCECRPSCDALVSTTFDEYESARRNVSHLVVAPGHAPADSAIAWRRSRFEIVEPPRE